MARRRLIWKFFPWYLLLLAAALGAVAYSLSQALHTFYLAHLHQELLARAALIAETIEQFPLAEAQPALSARTADLARRGDFRVTVVRQDGVVLADSHEDPATMNNHADRPEVIEALEGGNGYAYRFSHTLQAPMMYAAVPLRKDGNIAGILRVALPASEIQHALAGFYLEAALISLLVATLTGVLSWLHVRRIVRPLEVIRGAAERFARGEFKDRLPLSTSEELAAVAEALNLMARLLDERIEVIVRQRNEQEAVLSSMVESVLAVDNDGRIISLNEAAAQLLSVEPVQVEGKTLQAAVRNTSLQRLIADALHSALPIERELVLHTPEEQVLQAHGAVLRDAAGNHIGAVVVLNDITRLRRLEGIRRDFVANVSHELKTPVTAIKGFVETLLDPNQKAPEDARKFLEIISKQTNRLDAILSDLLTLSRLEQEAEVPPDMFQMALLKPLISEALQVCAAAAAARDVYVEDLVPDDLMARINPQLLEQAIINLVDNAIKYSEPQSTVTIRGESAPEEVRVVVEDHGCGISSEHVPRLFERFYRVDKGRSRRAGGTGLGLSIVKHIAQVHGGSVRVRSRTGEGSTFTIILPAPKT